MTPSTSNSQATQATLFSEELPAGTPAPFTAQLLKWVGNKQRQAPEIIRHFPTSFGTYFEPFLGSGGVLGVLSPRRALASDTFAPLIEIWQTLSDDKELLKYQYEQRYRLVEEMGKSRAYSEVLASYNSRPNGPDLLFLCRTCYGGVVRFRKNDGFMSTPVGVHTPMPPHKFAERVDAWHDRTRGARFVHADFETQMSHAVSGDLVYCDPPYADSQSILYGAQSFALERLFGAIEECASRGVRVALSIDGTKLSGRKICNVPIPLGLFKHERYVRVGRSMLKRFQMNGQSLEEHVVSDRLLLTY